MSNDLPEYDEFNDPDDDNPGAVGETPVDIPWDMPGAAEAELATVLARQRDENRRALAVNAASTIEHQSVSALLEDAREIEMYLHG